MEKLMKIMNKEERLVIGLMSGTSADGIDAALVRIKGKGIGTEVEVIAFKELQYDSEKREAIFKLFNIKSCTVDYVCYMNFLLGELFAAAALELIDDAGFLPEDIDLIGSHGQTVYHMPVPICGFGYNIASTLQIGEPEVIAERTGIVTVADFRARDIAAGGQGAPLVPYTEYILYREENKTIGLQNIGGIANITVLPAGCEADDIVAFDNGPGNMVIDELVRRLTDGSMTYDKDGEIAGRGRVNERLLDLLMKDGYFSLHPPKTTGREYFGAGYADKIMRCAMEIGIAADDIIATVTALTARAICESCSRYIIPYYGLDKVIIGGGGSYNKTLMKMIKRGMHGVDIITQEEAGFRSDAKEAVAFAILANETINGNCNNVPKATGAKRKVIMGKICI